MKPIPDELLEQLLEDYEKPEDLLGSEGLLASLPGTRPPLPSDAAPPTAPASGLPAPRIGTICCAVPRDASACSTLPAVNY